MPLQKSRHRNFVVFFKAIAEFFLLAVLALVSPLTVYLDVLVFKDGLYESSLTELIQEILLLLSTLVFWRTAWKMPQWRGMSILVAGFMTCMLIRELDEPLDNIMNGFWFYPAFLAAVAAIYLAIRNLETLLSPMSEFINTRAYVFILVGMVILLAFSRVFGSGTLLWTDILGSEYDFLFKSVLQEGLELLGYAFIFYGSFAFYRRTRLQSRKV